jgi:hypothetical protein
MAPAILFRVRPEAFRHPRILALVTHIAAGARHARTTARVGTLAFPRSIRVVFTNPAAILAEQAFHGLPGLPRLSPRISRYVLFQPCLAGQRGMARPGACLYQSRVGSPLGSFAAKFFQRFSLSVYLVTLATSVRTASSEFRPKAVSFEMFGSRLFRRARHRNRRASIPRGRLLTGGG